MTAVATDFDQDGWPDIYLACDSTFSLFFRNNRDGTFREEAVERGIAVNEDGSEQAGMGIAVGDINNDGYLDILKTHFADDTHILYKGDKSGHFSDITRQSGIGGETRYVGWGAGMPDLDNDGLADLFIATGNVYPDLARKLPAYPYRTSPLLFRNLGDGRFEPLTKQGGAAMIERHSSRGAAFGDLDNDGDIDIVLWNRNEPPSLLENVLKTRHHWLQLTLTGTRSNRSAIGAKVTVEFGSSKQVQAILSQSSFTSASDLRLHVGLGIANSAKIAVHWPSGHRESFTTHQVDRVIALTEGKGAELP
jgi:hypothetical protein